MQSLSVGIQTKVLNDLNEKVHKMAEIIDENHQRKRSYIILKSHQTSWHLRIIFCLSVLKHIRCIKEKVLDDDDRTGWLLWMGNCFMYGTVGEQWKPIRSEKWFSPDFENFLSKEIMPKPGPSLFATKLVINIIQFHLRVKDADKQIAFLKKAFEAKETKRFKLPDGSVVHAEIRIGDSAIMLSEASANSICLEVCGYCHSKRPARGLGLDNWDIGDGDT
jgi:hypothetical protein